MAKFAYEAINENGNPVTGTLDVDSVDTARNVLSSRGYIPSRIVQEGAAGGFSIEALNTRLATVRAWDLILYSKQFGTMLRAGIPIVRLFQILESQTENRKLKKVIGEQIQDIEAGKSLYEAFKKHSEVFSHLYCSMVQAGEASGSLPEVLDRLIYVIEHEYKIKKDIKAALAYPIIVVVFLAVAFLILLTFVVPKFVAVFTKAGIDIPLPTRICMILYSALSSYWWLGLIILVFIVVALRIYLSTDQGKLNKDALFVRIPLIGPLFIKAAMSRFASIFAILQASGVSVLEIVRILSGTIGNYAIAKVFDEVGEKLREGRGISEPLRSAEYFTPMVVNMVAVGEESGNLDEMLTEVSRHYDTEVEYATAQMAAAIGPILVIGLSAVVGFFALAIYLPMWDLTKMVQ